MSVPVERLVEMLWASPAPPSAATMVHGAVAVLRRVLEGEGRPRVLVTRDGGYALDVAAEQVDAARFEQALEVGRNQLRGSPRPAPGLLAAALAE
jgi:DNA-binding SARP family transcriptional activator